MSEKEIAESQKGTENLKTESWQRKSSGTKYNKRKYKRIQRIRARASYRLFRNLYDFLKKKPDIADILRKFYGILDAKRSFGSIRNAEYAAESLNWVLKDKGG